MLGGLLKTLDRKDSEPAVSFGTGATIGMLALLAVQKGSRPTFNTLG
jgi:hypothetical protein